METALIALAIGVTVLFLGIATVATTVVIVSGLINVISNRAHLEQKATKPSRGDDLLALSPTVRREIAAILDEAWYGNRTR